MRKTTAQWSEEEDSTAKECGVRNGEVKWPERREERNKCRVREDSKKG